MQPMTPYVTPYITKYIYHDIRKTLSENINLDQFQIQRYMSHNTPLVNDWVLLQNENNNKKYFQYPSALPWALTVFSINLLI